MRKDGYDRILKVAPPIANMTGREQVGAELLEAIQYRSLDRAWWRG